MSISTEKVRAQALKYERESVVVYWSAVALAPLFLGMFIYDLVRGPGGPLILAAITLALAIYAAIVLKVVRNGPVRLSPTQPCLDFLRRELKRKSDGLRWVRNCVLLVIPAVLAAWWGGGPVGRARELGIQSPWLLGFLQGPAFLLAMGFIIAFLWYAFDHQARKHDRELQNLPN
jgi:hypothetical protein